jgi:hypothetical protein
MNINIYFCLLKGNATNEFNEAEVGNLTHNIVMSHDWKTEGDDTAYSHILQMIDKDMYMHLLDFHTFYQLQRSYFWNF